MFTTRIRSSRALAVAGLLSVGACVAAALLASAPGAARVEGSATVGLQSRPLAYLSWPKNQYGKGLPVLMVARADGRDARSLGRVGGRPAWSPRGDFLVYADQHYHVVVMRLDGTRRVLPRTSAYARLGPMNRTHFVIAPDGRGLTFVHLPDTLYYFEYVDLQTGQQTLLDQDEGAEDDVAPTDFAWSSDTAGWALLDNLDCGGYRLGRTRILGRSSDQPKMGYPENSFPVALRSCPGVRWMDLSPDGRTFAFEATGTPYPSTDVWLQPAKSTKARRLVTEADTPSWTPNGRSLLVTARRNGNWDIYRFSAGGKLEAQLTRTPAAREEAPTLRPQR